MKQEFGIVKFRNKRLPERWCILRDALWLGLCWAGEQISQFPLASFLMIFHSLCALI